MPDWFPADLAEWIVFTPSRVIFIVLLCLLGRWLLHRLIDRSVRRAIARPSRRWPAIAIESASGFSSERRNQRILALSSLAKSLITVAVLVIGVIMVLAELGFNVTTIVASTSIIAAAVAFGTQSIVKDLLSGIFMLVEDQLGVGDYVDMNLASGTVEEIGLRITQLRADDGTVWYVRNGEVLRLGNYSKGGPDRPAVEEPSMTVRLAGSPSPGPGPGSAGPAESGA